MGTYVWHRIVTVYHDKSIEYLFQLDVNLSRWHMSSECQFPSFLMTYARSGYSRDVLDCHV